MNDSQGRNGEGKTRVPTLQKLLWFTIAAVIGASASYLVPRYLDQVALARAPIATGEWISEWRWDNEPEGVWHFEHVQIEHGFWGDLKIKCTYSPEGNQWVGSGRLVEQVRGTHVVGGWHSTKPGAIASGPFALSTLASHGESMYGYFTDYDDRNGNPVVATWVLGKDKSHLQDAKAWITSHRIPQPGSR